MGASWLNQVECWFAVLTQKQIRRGVHRSTRALETAIQEYIVIAFIAALTGTLPASFVTAPVLPSAAVNQPGP